MELTVISTFAGCGGSSLGYKWAGYKELLAIDFNKNAVQSFKANFPEVPIWKRDIREVTAKEILTFCNIKRGELSIFNGSPPCQGFSTAGKRKIEDDRNELSFEYIRLVDGLQPKVFLMENVAGLAKGKMVGMFNEIISEMQSLNYKVKCKLMNAMHYNVPQSRERLIFIGVRDDLNIEPSFPAPSTNVIPLRQVIPNVEGYHPGVFERDIHSANKVVCTITKTSCQRFIRNGKEVKPTISEIKKVCSFPENFKLVGNYDQQWARLGNAVMPKFMQAIAKHVRDKILSNSHSVSLDQLPAPKKYQLIGDGKQKTASTIKKIKIKRQSWKPSLTSQFKICPIPYHLDTYRGCDMKTKERIKKNGEIFTPPKLVEEMLEKISLQIWKDPSKTVGDPSAGNGNFLVAAFNRKTKYGSTPTQALSTINGVELMLDNTLECRERLLELACATEGHRRIVERNIVNADVLKYDYSFR